MSKRKTMAIMDGTQVKVMDIATGEILEPEQYIGQENFRKIVPLQDEEGKIIHVEKGITLEDLRPGPKYKFKYSPLLGDIICQKIAEGKSVMSICKEEGMPSYSTIARWRRDNPEFNTQFKQAKEDRSEYFADKAVEVAEETHSKDDTPAARLKMDAYKWRAQMDNPKDYSNQTKVVGDPDQPIAIKIETGIRRKGDEGFVDVTESVEKKLLEEGDKDGEDSR